MLVSFKTLFPQRNYEQINTIINTKHDLKSIKYLNDVSNGENIPIVPPHTFVRCHSSLILQPFPLSHNSRLLSFFLRLRPSSLVFQPQAASLISCIPTSGCVPRLLYSNLRLRPSSLVFQPQAASLISCIPTSGYAHRLLYSNLSCVPRLL
jgi:hypothetical protein